MKTQRSLKLSILLKSLGVFFGLVGLGFTFFRGDGIVSSGNAILYFTIQSNIWILLTMGVYLVLAIRGYRGQKVEIPRWLALLKYIFTVSIALTFVVFALLLSPFMSLSYLTSPSNLCMHFLAPIAAILDFLFFDGKNPFGKKDVLWTLIPPLYYLVFALGLSFTGIKFAEGASVPYYFLDYTTRGWFSISDAGLGIVYWILLMLLLVTGLAFGLRSLSARIGKRRA